MQCCLLLPGPIVYRHIHMLGQGALPTNCSIVCKLRDAAMQGQGPDMLHSPSLAQPHLFAWEDTPMTRHELNNVEVSALACRVLQDVQGRGKEVRSTVATPNATSIPPASKRAVEGERTIVGLISHRGDDIAPGSEHGS